MNVDVEPAVKWAKQRIAASDGPAEVVVCVSDGQGRVYEVTVTRDGTRRRRDTDDARSA
ncbi:MAG: hypothetical protein KGS10_05610 [Chloroflexi bacterium]|nr:hypothetical protein [Chloroflexota bacterium]